MKNLTDSSFIDLHSSVVLAVDDQPINLEILKCCLEDSYQVVCATTGEEALSSARLLNPDVILLDVMLDGISGLDVCRELKEDPALADIPVIFVTSNESIADESNCWEAGGNDYIRKPIRTETLRHRVKTHLTVKLQQDKLRKASYIDPLTGLHNYNYLLDQLANYYNNQQVVDFDFTLLLIKIDNYDDIKNSLSTDQLKLIQKKLGHAICGQIMGNGDITSKLYENQYALVCHNISPESATEAANRINDRLTSLVINYLNSLSIAIVKPKICIGLVKSTHKGIHNAEELVNLAESACQHAVQSNTTYYYLSDDSVDNSNGDSNDW